MSARGKRQLWLAAALAFGLLLTLAVLALTGATAFAGATQVGNGDDGADLEGAKLLKSGPFIEARDKAVERLKSLGVEGIPGLGHLIPEVERAPLYMSKRDMPAEENHSNFHADMRGLLFAASFPEPDAPTRFFPVAKTLSEDQLIALNIHEGLHRALPPTVREDENVVSQITLAITSPEASHDRVKKVAARYVSEEDVRIAKVDNTLSTSAPQEKYPIPETAKIKHPSTLGYTYKSFNNTNQETQISPLTSMHVLQSFLYPFGNDRHPLGIGIEASFLNRQDGDSEMGPLGLSARFRLWSTRGFDIGLWAQGSLNTLSSEELKNTPYGRDVFTLGMSAQKDTPFFYIENLLGYTTSGQATQQIGSVTYTHDYGSIVNATVRAGAKYKGFHLGGFGEIDLADYYRVNGGAFSFDSGRYQITSGGPELTFETESWSVGIFGRYILSSSKGASFDYLGNVLGQGVGQGSIGGTLAIKL